jgi:hypothetical protein
MHIYAFGSVCRGEIDHGSDVDLLACVDGAVPKIDPKKYSIYRYERLKDLWREGNPFAWHLHLESSLIFSSDGLDFLRRLGSPQPYRAGASDCAKFKALFDRSWEELKRSPNSATFHLSCMFLAVRNFATCHSLLIGAPVFSRNSPLIVRPSLDMAEEAFSILTRARLLSTRGYGDALTEDEIAATIDSVAIVPQWMERLRSTHHVRV